MLCGLSYLAAALAGLYAFVTLMNLAVFRRPPRPRADARPAVSLLIPARDEAANIDGALKAALAGNGVDLEVIVLDDGPSDGTDAKVRAWAARDGRVRLVGGANLPSGWNGKQHACWQLSRNARHDVMVFVDADVRLRPNALARLCAALERHRLDLASGFPRQTTETLAEALVIPQIHVLLLGYLPLPFARLFAMAPGFAAGCGQLMAVRREAYEATGGHSAIRETRHDGLMLPRLFRRNGLRTDLFDAADLADCRMYAGWDEVSRGFAKNATEGMATPVALPVWTVLLGGGHVLPFLLLPVATLTGAHVQDLRSCRSCLFGSRSSCVGGGPMRPIRISGGEVLGADGFAVRDLCLEDGLIVEDAPDAGVVDARGLLVLPGIIDIHGDAFERQIMPRPGVCFDLGLALMETDRQLVTNGITTAYHGLSVSWEPGLRSLEAARGFVDALSAVRCRLGADTLLHVRWEPFAAEAIDLVASWLEREPKAILAFNDHLTPLIGGGHMARKLDKLAARAGMTPEEYRGLAEGLWARRETVAEDVARMAGIARRAGAVLLAHDETSPEMRATYRTLGARASEFPMTIETARAARAAGEHVIMGAPNVLRGGSHNNAIAAAEAVLADECTVLTSDYYYPAPLVAPFVLARRHGMDLARAWALVSAHPAEVAGLADRGRLTAGMRADVLLVDAGDDRASGGWPEVRAAWVAGRQVLRRA